jgi:glycosyltransferase involved in cell wall biosynthesis
VVSPFVDRRHGTERALAELLERLARNFGCEVHLYAQRVEDLALDDPSTPRSGEAGAIVWHRVPSVAGPHLVKFLGWMVMNSLLRWRDNCLRSTSFALVLSPGINCLNADVIIVHALFHRLRELARAENADEPQQRGFFRRLHRRLYYGLLTALERRVYSDQKISLAAVSQRTAALLNKYFHRQDIRIVPNGVDAAQFSPSVRLALRPKARLRRNFQDTDFVLLLIGNDWHAKGLSKILAAMASCLELPLHLLVAGEDSSEAFCEIAAKLGLLDRFHCERPRPDVIDLYAAADAYVSPTREDAFALPPLEAMACGLPVVTSVHNGGAQIITDTVDGFVLRDLHDPVPLAKIIQLLYEQENLRESIGEAAAKTASGWTWGRNAEAVWQLLKDAAKKHSTHVLHGNP